MVRTKPLGRLKSVLDQFPQVRRFLDAKRGLKVEVLQRDCSLGKKGKSSECAMARAVKREFDADGVIIRMGYSYVIKGPNATRYKTSNAVTREIVSFDRHHDFAPGVYTLRPPCKTAKLGGIHGSGGASKHPGKKLKQRTFHTTAGVRTWHD